MPSAWPFLEAIGREIGAIGVRGILPRPCWHHEIRRNDGRHRSRRRLIGEQRTAWWYGGRITNPIKGISAPSKLSSAAKSAACERYPAATSNVWECFPRQLAETTCENRGAAVCMASKRAGFYSNSNHVLSLISIVHYFLLLSIRKASPFAREAYC